MIFSNQLGKLDGYTSEEAVRTIANHIRKMQEEMEYRLMTLDSSNISEISLDETKVLLKGQPLQNVLQDNEGMSVLEQKVNELRATVAAVSGNYTTLSLTVEGLQSTVSGYEATVNGYAAQVSTFNQTVNGFNTTVSNYQTAVNGYAAQVSSFNQEANAIYAVVSNLQTGMSASLRLGTDGLVYTDNDGKVTIKGGNLDASTVTASSLVGGEIKVKQGDSDYGRFLVGANSANNYGFEMRSKKGLRLLGEGGNVFLQAYSDNELIDGAHITINSYAVSLGGVLVISKKAYGDELPEYGEDGQVFFLLS